MNLRISPLRALPLAIAMTALLLAAATAAAAPPPNFCPPGTAAGQCQSTLGVAVDQSTGAPTSGDVYLANSGNNRIDAFDSAGHFLRAFGFGVLNGADELQTCTTACERGRSGSAAGEITPAGVAVDNDPSSASFHDLYVTDTRGSRVEKFTPAGEFLLMFGKGVDQGPHHPGDVCKAAYLAEGDTCGAGSPGSGPGQLNGNKNESPPVAVDASGHVWVGDVNRLERFGPDGEFLSEMAVPGAGVISGLAIDTDPASPNFEDLYALNKPVNEVQKASPPPTGKFTLSFEGHTSRAIEWNDRTTVFEEAAAEILGGAGNVAMNWDVSAITFRLEFRGRLEGRNVPQLEISAGPVVTEREGVPAKVAKLSPAGALLETIDEAGYPKALGLDPASGDLYVSDWIAPGFNEAPRAGLSEYSPSGAQTESFGTGGVLGTPSGNALAFGSAAQRLYVAGGNGAQAFPLPAPGPLPEENSAKAEPVAKTTATLKAGVNPEGHATTAHFQYVDQQSFETEGGFAGPHTKTTAESASVGADFSQHPVPPVAITGLEPETTYRFRLVATNECEPVKNPGHKCVIDGEDATFTTLPPFRIDATYATEVSATAATLGAEINPLGDPATYHFEYLTQAQYVEDGESFSGPNTPASTPEAGAGSGNADVTRSAQVAGLLPSTSYRYRVVVANAIRPAGVPGPVRSLTTQGAASLLPDSRGWEMVTPPNKHGAPIEPITHEGGLIQAAADGGTFASVADGPIGPESPGTRSPEVNQLLSRRGAGGWSTQDITPPNEKIVLIRPGFFSQYNFFAEDLSAAIVEPFGATPLSPQTTERTPYRRETADGTFVPLLTAANVPPGTEFGGQEQPNGSWNGRTNFVSASPDARHVVLNSNLVLAAGFAAGFVPKEQSLYELSGGALTLVSILPSGEPAAEAGLTAAVAYHQQNMRGAISADGDRVFFEAGNHLYLRDLAHEATLQLDQLQPGGVGGPDQPVFQAASRDGDRVFFTDTARLVPGAAAQPNQPDLYMCEITVEAGQPACALSDLSLDSNPGEAANVQGVSAIAADGSHVYFAANGALTSEANEHGEQAVPGGPNLYGYDVAAHKLSLIAVLAGADGPDWSVSELSRLTARSSPDGRYLAFMSQRPLTGYDNRDAKSGQPDQEVFLYDSATGKLVCPSCNPTGARPLGVFDAEVFPGPLVDHNAIWRGHWLAASVPGWTAQALTLALYQSRYLSDSGRLFFNSSDALVPADTNGVMDVYQYEPPGVGSCTQSSPSYSSVSGGCVDLISSGASPEESAFLDASESGNDVFFLTASRLTPKDIDGAFDVYDASVGGGEAPVLSPPACQGDSCQLPAAPPNDPTPGSLTFNGAGNVHEEEAPALHCKKGKVKKNGKCVARKHHKSKHKKKGHKRAAKSKRGSK